MGLENVLASDQVRYRLALYKIIFAQLFHLHGYQLPQGVKNNNFSIKYIIITVVSQNIIKKGMIR